MARHMDIIGSLTFLIAFVFIYPSPLFCLFLCLRKLDPFYYIFQYFLLSTLANSYPVFALRTLLTFICLFEYIRCSYFLSVVPLTVIAKTIRQLHDLNRVGIIKNSSIIYTQIQLIFKTYHKPLKIANLLAISGWQIFLSLEAVVIIGGWNKLPPPLTGFFVMIFGISTFVAFMYAKWAAKVSEASQELIHGCFRYTKEHKRNEFEWKVMAKVWGGKDRVKIYYGDGSSHEFQRHSPSEFLFVLLNNITNLLILTLM